MKASPSPANADEQGIVKGEGGRDAAVFHGTIQRHTLAGSYPKGKGSLQVNELNGLWRGKLPVSAILAKNLKIVVRAGAGYDNVDLDAATAHKVCVMNTPGQNSNAVAELVFGMLVYGVRNFYNGTSGTELKGKKLGILAYGNVGRNVARIAKGFGMEVYAYDAFCPASVIEADGVKAVASTADLFKACQIVSLHIPATAETKGSINFELMNSMPKGAIVVNTARKEVMDEAGLAKMLEERPDFKYLTDIMPAIHAELAEKYAGRYFSTPKKMGAQTAEANINAGIAAAKQIVDFLVNGNEKYRVNK